MVFRMVFPNSTHHREDIDKPLAPADGEGVLLKNPIDVALNAWLGIEGVRPFREPHNKSERNTGDSTC